MSAFTYFTKQTEAEGLTASQLLMLAALSMEDLSWDHYMKDGIHLYARCHMGLFSWGESVSVTVTEEGALIICKQPAWKLIKKERGKKNIDDLVEYMNHNRQIYSPEMLEEEFDNRMARRSDSLNATERIVMSRDIPVATLVLIAINAICFLIFSFSTASFWDPRVMDIFHWGGNIRLHTLGGDGWRLLTSCFLHWGFAHLACNMFALFFIGRYLEPVLKPFLFTTGYLCTGIMSSVASIFVAGNRLSVGASGAIFGLFGIFIALLTTRLLTGEIKRVLFQGIMFFTAYSLFDGMGEGVDNAAHVGGLISGFIFGYLIYAGFDSVKGKAVSGTAMLAVTLIVSLAYLSFFHNDSVRYEIMLKRMARLENDALVPRTDMKTKPVQDQLNGLVHVSRPAWREFKKISDSTIGFRFGRNKIYQMQSGLLSRYAALRIAENEIWIQSLRNGTGMQDQKDSIRLLVYEKSDSLTALPAMAKRMEN